MHNLTSRKLYQFNEETRKCKKILAGCQDLRTELDNVHSKPVEKEAHLSIKDPLVYIYTSGTTGLPKAAVITNIRFVEFFCKYKYYKILIRF